MSTEILKSFGTLQSELEQARNSLRGVDENIKRLIGRDPSDLPPNRINNNNMKRQPPGKQQNSEDSRGGGGRGGPRGTGNSGPNLWSSNRNYNNNNNNNHNHSSHENDEPPAKTRRTGGMSVFKRLSDRPGGHYEDDTRQQPPKQMISKVIVTPKELPSRQEALALQSKDEKSKARNRRMFGALIGTLQKFQQEETKLKPKEDKRAQLEKKIEEHEIKEKEEIKKERQELFFNRKKKQAEIKMIELKMMRMKEYAAWEERQKPRMNFIQTKTKPQIYFLPRKLNETNKAMLETCRGEIEKMIDVKRQEVFDELQHIEERMKRNFETRKTKDDNTANNNNNNNNNNNASENNTNTKEERRQQHDEDDEEEEETSDPVNDHRNVVVTRESETENPFEDEDHSMFDLERDERTGEKTQEKETESQDNDNNDGSSAAVPELAQSDELERERQLQLSVNLQDIEMPPPLRECDKDGDQSPANNNTETQSQQENEEASSKGDDRPPAAEENQPMTETETVETFDERQRQSDGALVVFNAGSTTDNGSCVDSAGFVNSGQMEGEEGASEGGCV